MDAILTLPQAAQYLKLSTHGLYKLVERGEVPAAKVGRQWRFQRQFLDEWLTRRRPARRKLVLVVDDDPGIRELFAEALRAKGHQVVTASGGYAAVELTKNFRFDAILLDIVMPDLNGTETLRAIQQIDPGVPVALVTAYPEHPLVGQALELAPFLLMRKPARLEEIYRAVEMMARVG